MTKRWGRLSHGLIRVGVAIGLMQAGIAPVLAKKIALVIGNNAYDHLSPLGKAAGDANAIKVALERLGFTVTLAQDIGYAAFVDTIATFEGKIDGGDEVVVHYSGHGVAINGRNYLIPVDMQEPRSNQPALITRFAQDAGEMVDSMRARQPKYVFAILDACRNNPFRGTARAIGAGRGLARMQAEAGAFILFSAGEGETALDGLGPDDPSGTSVFTRVLLQYLEQPGLTLQDLAKATQGEVKRLAATFNNHQQFPDYSDRTIDRPMLRRADETPEEIPTRGQDEADIAFRIAMNDGSDAALLNFAQRFPTDRRALQVVEMLEQQKRSREERRRQEAAELQRRQDEADQAEAKREQERRRQEAIELQRRRDEADQAEAKRELERRRQEAIELQRRQDEADQAEARREQERRRQEAIERQRRQEEAAEAEAKRELERRKQTQAKQNAPVCGWFAILHCSEARSEAETWNRQLRGGEIINTSSGRFPNFRPGYYCVVNGPMSRSRANAIVEAWRSRFSDVYTKKSC